MALQPIARYAYFDTSMTLFLSYSSSIDLYLVPAAPPHLSSKVLKLSPSGNMISRGSSTIGFSLHLMFSSTKQISSDPSIYSSTSAPPYFSMKNLDYVTSSSVLDTFERAVSPTES